MKISIKTFAGKKLSMLQKMMITSLLIAILPTLIIGLTGYWYSSSTLQAEINKANYQFLMHSSDVVERQMKNIQVNMMQMLGSPYFVSNYEADLGKEPLMFITEVLSGGVGLHLPPRRQRSHQAGERLS